MTICEHCNHNTACPKPAVGRKACAEFSRHAATKELLSAVTRKLAQMGYDLVEVKPYSQHPGDWFLSRVLARRNGSHDLARACATWIVNHEDADKPFLVHGHYDQSESEARSDLERGA